MFSTLVFIIFTWVFIGLVFVGIGLLFQRFVGISADSFAVILDSFWLGFCFLVFFLQVWNFWLPVNTASFYVLSTAGFIGIFLSFKSFRPCFSRIDILFIFLLSLASIYLAGVASLPFIRYDHGLYYSNLIQWAESFPVVKGLGNLHGRLAFNNAYYLYAAWVETLPWIKRSHHFVTGVLLMGLLIQILYSYFKILKNKTIEVYHIFYAGMFWPVIFLIQTSLVASPAADTGISILQVVLFAKVLLFLDQSIFSSRKIADAFFIIILSVVGICIKASMLAFAVSLWGILLFLILNKRLAEFEIQETKLIIYMGGIIFLGLLPWMLRNILVSGYIFYPLDFGGFPVLWKIPYEQLLVDMKGTMSYARAPGESDYGKVLGNSKWFWPWLLDNWKTPFSFKIPVCLAMAGLSGILLRLFLRTKVKLRAELWLSFVPVVISMIVWFLSVPDVRFAGALFWILSISVLVFALVLWIGQLRILKIICALIFVSAVFYLFIETVKTVKVTLDNAVYLKAGHTHMDEHLKLGPAFNDIFDDLPVGNYLKNKTDSGLIVFTPILGESCWDRIPCTPNFNMKFRLIRSSDISSGFMIDSSDSGHRG